MRSFKIQNGDYVLDHLNRLEVAAEDDATRQRINNRLVIRRGSFLYDRQLGSKLHLLHRAKPSERPALAVSYVEEALLPEVQDGAVQKVERVEVLYPEPHAMLVRVECRLQSGQAAETEVPIKE